MGAKNQQKLVRGQVPWTRTGHSASHVPLPIHARRRLHSGAHLAQPMSVLTGAHAFWLRLWDLCTRLAPPVSPYNGQRRLLPHASAIAPAALVANSWWASLG